MIKNRLKKEFIKEEGSGLVLSLMVLLVLSVLGASLGVVTIGSLQLSDANRDSNSAYYIAEAGANRAYEEFKQTVKQTADGLNGENQSHYFNVFKNIQEKEYTDFDPQFGGKPTATVNIIPPKNDRGDTREYTIQSTGEVGDKSRTVEKKVEVTWIPPKKEESIRFKFPKIPEGAVLIASEEIEIKDKGRISDSGDVYFTKDNKGYKLNGKIVKGTYKPTDKEFSPVDNWEYADDWKVPVIPKQAQDTSDWKKYDEYKKILDGNNYKDLKLSELSNSTKVLSGNYKVSDSKIGKNYQFTMGNADVNIFVDKIELEKATLEVKGTGNGKLTFIVKDDSEIKEKSRVEGNIISRKKVEIKEDSFIIGDVFAQGEVEVAKRSKVTGSIVADGKIEIKEKSVVSGNILTKSEVEIEESKIEGNVIAEEKIEIKKRSTVSGNVLTKGEVEVKETSNIGGDIIAEKKIEIKEKTTVSGNVLTKADIEIKDNVQVSKSLVAEKDILIDESNYIDGNILSKGHVTIKDKNDQVHGSIISNKMTIYGHVQYKTHPMKDIVFGKENSNEGPSNIDIDELINSGPTLESNE